MGVRDVSIRAVWYTETTGVRRMGFQAKRKMLTVGILSIPRWSRRQATLPRCLSMADPHSSDSSAAPHDRYVPALDGLRGVAAMQVAGGHYMAFEGGAPLSVTASTVWA